MQNFSLDLPSTVSKVSTHPSSRVPGYPRWQVAMMHLENFEDDEPSAPLRNHGVLAPVVVGDGSSLGHPQYVRYAFPFPRCIHVEEFGGVRVACSRLLFVFWTKLVPTFRLRHSLSWRRYGRCPILVMKPWKYPSRCYANCLLVRPAHKVAESSDRLPIRC